MIGDDLQALLDRTLGVLDGAGCDMRGGGEQWRGTCPLCGQRDLTLRVDLGQRRLWLDCWRATCGWQEIQDALGLTRDDLRIEAEPVGGELVRRSFDQIKFEPVRFLVNERVPLQGLTLLVGDPFAGKSTWTALITAGVTTGVYGEPGTVAILNAEDATAVTTGPRAKAAGADLSRVEELTVRVDEHEQVITLPDDVPKLEAWAVETGARLLILDPLMMFLTERADANKDHGVRRALASLAMMAERQRLAVLVCAHMNKDEQQRMLYRVGGSIGIVGLARSVLFLAHDPDDPDGDDGDLRLLAHAASNWSKRAATLRYRIEAVSWEQHGERITTTRMVADGEAELTAEEPIAAPRRPLEPSKVELAEDAICEALAEGSRPSIEVKAEVVSAVSCAAATVQRAAMQLRMDGVLTSSGSAQATRWHLASVPDQQPEHAPLKDDDEKAELSSRARAHAAVTQPSHHHPGRKLIRLMIRPPTGPSRAAIARASRPSCCAGSSGRDRARHRDDRVGLPHRPAHDRRCRVRRRRPAGAAPPPGSRPDPARARARRAVRRA